MWQPKVWFQADKILIYLMSDTHRIELLSIEGTYEIILSFNIVKLNIS